MGRDASGNEESSSSLMVKLLALFVAALIVVAAVATFVGNTGSILGRFGFAPKNTGSATTRGGISVPPHLSPSNRHVRSLAVPDFDIKAPNLPEDASIAMAATVSDLFPDTHFEVLSRRILEERLRAAKVTMDALSGSAELASKFGRAQGVRFILSGIVERSGERLTLRLRMLHTGSGEIVTTTSVTADDYEALRSSASEAVQALFDSF